MAGAAGECVGFATNATEDGAVLGVDCTAGGESAELCERRWWLADRRGEQGIL